MLSAAVLGVDGVPVRVEADVAFGLPSLTIVGLAGSAIQEARERVRSALRNSGFEVPARRITVNLAPADLPKEGTGYDLAIAAAILGASGQLGSKPRRRCALVGELALDGTLRAVPGAMALVAAAGDAGVEEVVVPVGNAAEAANVRGVRVRAAERLGEVVAHLAGVRELPAVTPRPLPAWNPSPELPDLADVIGQPLARRALEIAIAGGHSLALSGPPGVGHAIEVADHGHADREQQEPAEQREDAVGAERVHRAQPQEASRQAAPYPAPTASWRGRGPS